METISHETVSYLKIFGLLFTKPTKAFNLILEKDETLPQLIILGLYGFLNVVTPIIVNEPLAGLTIFKIVFKGLFGAAAGWLGIWFLSHLINLTNHILKAESEFEDVYFLFSYSLCPLIFIFLFILVLKAIIHSSQIILPITGLLILIGYIWTFILVYKGNKLVSKGNWIKNIIAVFIPVLLIIGINIILLSFNI